MAGEAILGFLSGMMKKKEEKFKEDLKRKADLNALLEEVKLQQGLPKKFEYWINKTNQEVVEVPENATPEQKDALKAQGYVPERVYPQVKSEKPKEEKIPAFQQEYDFYKNLSPEDKKVYQEMQAAKVWGEPPKPPPPTAEEKGDVTYQQTKRKLEAEQAFGIPKEEKKVPQVWYDKQGNAKTFDILSPTFEQDIKGYTRENPLKITLKPFAANLSNELAALETIYNKAKPLLDKWNNPKLNLTKVVGLGKNIKNWIALATQKKPIIDPLFKDLTQEQRNFIYDVGGLYRIVYGETGKQINQTELSQMQKRLPIIGSQTIMGFENNLNGLTRDLENSYNTKLNTYKKSNYNVGKFSLLGKSKEKPRQGKSSAQQKADEIFKSLGK